MADSGQKSNHISLKRKKQLAASGGSQVKQRKINQVFRSKKSGRACKAFIRPCESNEPEPEKVDSCKILQHKKVYRRLANNLREHAIDAEDLTDQEVIAQFEIEGTDTDTSASEQCICGKNGLVNLAYVKNKKLKEMMNKATGKKKENLMIEYATNTHIIGSKCIDHWYKCIVTETAFDSSKDPVIFIMELTKWLKGIQGQCCAEREEPLKKSWIITIKSEIFYEQYDAVNKR